MSNTVDVAFVRQFNDSIYDRVEQKGSKVLPHVMPEVTNSKIHYFELMGAATVEEIATRHGATPAPNNIAHTRRGAILRGFHAAEYLDDWDRVRMLINPQDRYAQKLVNALGRQADDILLNALYGSANSYDRDEAATGTALSAGQIIDEDFGAANSGLTIAKLIEARRLLLANNADLDAETPILLLDAQAQMDLLGTTQITSSDYNTVKALVAGEVDTFMGFKFVPCQRLADAQHKTSENFVRSIVFMPSALGVVKNGDMETKISERNDLSHSVQVYSRMFLGAVRLEEEKVVVIENYRT